MLSRLCTTLKPARLVVSKNPGSSSGLGLGLSKLPNRPKGNCEKDDAPPGPIDTADEKDRPSLSVDAVKPSPMPVPSSTLKPPSASPVTLIRRWNTL